MCAVLDEMINEGYEKGEKQGSLKEKTEIAQKMIRAGLPFEQICEITGLSEKQVNELR